ncbi:hypothetical protein GF327_01105 [Candidatus Woesearchaeota archaeon]|nr:hypothetical protein [Candidatus Woesearchaeota archaeon]
MTRDFFDRILELLKHINPSLSYFDHCYYDICVIGPPGDLSSELLSIVVHSEKHPLKGVAGTSNLQGGLSVILDDRVYATFDCDGNLIGRKGGSVERNLQKLIIPSLITAVNNPKKAKKQVYIHTEYKNSSDLAVNHYSEDKLEKRKKRLITLTRSSSLVPNYIQNNNDLTVGNYLRAATIVSNVLLEDNIELLSPDKLNRVNLKKYVYQEDKEVYDSENRDSASFDLAKYAEEKPSNRTEIINGTCMLLREDEDDSEKGYRIELANRYPFTERKQGKDDKETMDHDLEQLAEKYLNAYEALNKAGFPINIDRFTRKIMLGEYNLNKGSLFID